MTTLRGRVKELHQTSRCGKSIVKDLEEMFSLFFGSRSNHLQVVDQSDISTDVNVRRQEL